MKTTFTKEDVEEFILTQEGLKNKEWRMSERRMAIEVFNAFWDFLRKKEQPPEIFEAIKLLESNGYKVKK